MNKLCSLDPINLSVSAYATLSHPRTAVSTQHWTSCQLSIPTAAPPGDSSGAVPGRLRSGWEDAAQHQELAPATPKAALAGSEIRERVELCQQPQDPRKGSKILKPLMRLLVSGFNPESFSWHKSQGGFHTAVLKAEVCTQAGSATWSFLLRNFGLLSSMDVFQARGHSHTSSVTVWLCAWQTMSHCFVTPLCFSNADYRFSSNAWQRGFCF